MFRRKAKDNETTAVDSAVTTPEIPPTTETEAEKPLPPPRKKPGRLHMLWRWFLLLLTAFALGALAFMLLFYLPLRQELANTQGSLRSELQSSQERAGELETQVGSLETLETRNQELEQELAQTQTQLILVSTQADIAAARLALAQDDVAGARSALTGAERSLESLAPLVEGETLASVEAMQDRLELASGELDENAFAAESDLNVLANNLLQLENSLFAGE